MAMIKRIVKYSIEKVIAAIEPDVNPVSNCSFKKKKKIKRRKVHQSHIYVLIFGKKP